MTKFTDLGLNPDILKAVADTGYDTPTAIQEQAIPIALIGLDVLGIAQTGTGKTAAFTLPMIEKLASGRSRARMPRAIVLAPTRELADQVAEAFEKYAKYCKLNWALLIGGVSMADQVAKLDKGVDVLIATPGRLLDLFERSKVMLNGVQLMVVDEADRMLDMGFIPDIERIFKLTPPSRQTLFFSATMPPEITRLTEQFLKNPVRIEVSRPATTNENITQYVYRVPSGDSKLLAKAKRLALRTLIGQLEINNGIVFCNRKTDVDIVAKSLSVHGFNAAPIHGDLDQSLRMKTLDAFRSGELKLLVASDVAARGLDIPSVSHVFNFDVPHHADDYVHRIGRTGRAGRTGEAYLILAPNDEKNYDKVLKLIKKEPNPLELDVDWSPLADARPEREKPARGRGERTERDRSARPRRERGRKSESAPEAVAEVVVPEEVVVDAAPLPEKKTRRRKSPVADTPPPRATAVSDDFPLKDNEDSLPKGPDGLGFGGHVPAFMLRSAYR
ncbi:DEAD/DEAH box helicase [Asticcacaulis excentricus]|uniref:DEAD-box ATP-dependent RNA helicase RhpA n=1 Tax=Asticcacaulis excentricus TaxID=78587 RepID=A0A3G9GAM9_9CAUL|nr:DEAD/DEAH box helicase [Asticcacaulis excentricus]BBF82294.1 ATP-dependent RNA helicase Atu1833 [Asticcacaulis excentricus]